MKPKGLSLIIVAHKFAWRIDDVVDGLTHRYYGLYANLCKLNLRMNGCAFWYSVKDRLLLRFSEGCIRVFKHSVFGGILKAILESISRRVFIIAVIDYPHSFLGIKYLLGYLASLLLLHLIRILNRGFIVVDNMDPPIEHAYELKGNVKLAERMLWLLLNNIVFRFDLIIFPTQSYRLYHRQVYGLEERKSIVVPHGSFPEWIPYKKPPYTGALKILCSGDIIKWVDVNALNDLVEELVASGLDLELIVISKNKGIWPRNWSRIKVLPPITFKEFSDCLSRVHLLLLIRPKSLHHMLTMRASLADYLMSGRPIVYVKSLGNAEVIKRAGCGFAFQDLHELKQILTQLCKEKSLIETLGYRARVFAEFHMVYKKHANELFREILLRISKKLLRYAAITC